MEKHLLLLRKLIETINLASDLSVRETDQYARCVEELLKAQYSLSPSSEEAYQASLQE